jgi:hypothetical protein
VTADAADVVFGRREYVEQGRSYLQIWTLDSRSRAIAPVSKSERRHVKPVCTGDGGRIWFLSGPFGDDRNTELWWFDPASRVEKLALTFPGSITRLLGGSKTQALFTAFEDAEPGLYRWDGKLAKLSRTTLAGSEAAVLSPDGQNLAVQTGDEESVTMMSTAGTQGRTIPRCAAPVWSADARLLACTGGNSVRVIDLATGIEQASVPFQLRPTPAVAADFSPDASQLLVKTAGANHSSTSPQSDFWVLHIASGQWSYVGPGQSAAFAPGGGVVVGAARELGAVGAGKDWLAPLLLVDPATHAQSPVGDGAAYNADPCRCSITAKPPTVAKAKGKRVRKS